MHQPINFGGADPCPYETSDVIHELRIEFSSRPHTLALLLGQL
jgi:hypothetical protein